jgi:hypothetical protein
MHLNGLGRKRYDLIELLSLNLPEEPEEERGKRVMIAGTAAEIRIKHLLNTRVERYLKGHLRT